MVQTGSSVPFSGPRVFLGQDIKRSMYRTVSEVAVESK